MSRKSQTRCYIKSDNDMTSELKLYEPLSSEFNYDFINICPGRNFRPVTSKLYLTVKFRLLAVGHGAQDPGSY